MTESAIKQSKHEFSSQRELTDWLQNTVANWEKRTTILAGHHLIVYRWSTARLVPLSPTVAEGAAGTDDEKRLVRHVGDLAERTFDLGLELALDLRENGCETKLALLINDHQFRKLQPGVPKGDRISVARTRYYRTNQPLPDFLAQRLPESEDPASLLEKNHRANPEGMLPREGFLFSELQLRRTFENQTKDKLLDRPGFEWRQELFAGRKLLYAPEDEAATCLVDENGNCGCSGELIEFLLQLSTRGVKNTVFFIPMECRKPVEGAVSAVMQGLGLFEDVLIVFGEPDLDTGNKIPPSTLSWATHFKRSVQTAN